MENVPDPDTIYTEYHPSSGRAPTLKPLHKHGHRLFPDIVPEKRPWEPFRTRLDFEILEFAMETGLNRKQLSQYINLIHRAAKLASNDDEERFTVQSATEAMKLWDLAASRRVPFQTETIEQQYKREPQPRSFEFIYRDPWEWALQSIRDPRLQNHIVWDPERAYRWNGGGWERFFDEPWSAEAWWRAQSLLPNDALKESKIIPFIIYADKDKLSSFGTATGYPIVARLANLPVGIRNSEGIGGGCVVGWLPIVKEETSETGKTGFVNFKAAVYHSSFKRFLTRIAELSKVGSKTKCGDGVWRLLWPLILILSADYEEFTIMALIRGLKSGFPCPVCLVPRDLQWDLSKEFSLRTQAGSQAILYETMKLSTQEQRNTFLKESGSLRGVENAFWSVNHTDLHAAISYDCLHSDENGLWEDHFFPVFKDLAKELGRQNVSLIDNRFDAVPRWRDLHHFGSVMNITFNDGSKNKDISKVFLYAAQPVFTRDRNSAGYRLMCCLRKYLNVRLYADFNLHTESTLSATQDELEHGFHSSGTVGMKSWNFPKIHLRKHLCRDIREKGVTRNYSTKPNEKVHGPIRKIYLRRTNFKDTANQILQAEHHLTVAAFIRNQIDVLDDYIRTKSVNSNESEEDQNYRKLGAPQAPCSFDDFETEHQGTRSQAFSSFRKKLSRFLDSFLPSHNISFPGPPGTRALKLKKTDELIEWRYLRIKYTCSSDWELKVDHVRCNPQFHGAPRYDCVLINGTTENFFARVLAFFTLTINGHDLSFAYVQPFNPLYQHLNRLISDRELELLRFREQPEKESIFISIHSIIRGAVMIKAEEGSGAAHRGADYFLFDLLDCDMFLRGREILKR
ncbi:hypothetical protein AGABI1DRAFT_45711 [Agaricus bisporus var. burnettii JB137-S8]|uniref:Uncharacterized protein n=1 Tax=Agaricus bisporus var. burnettii (strain JB137-S8 / ATCC MYA-4627 / FGSC 10392) TaxID=597362 RepID=K5XMN1_AGABU|nr:uncharacterized protein AGABI1DRAFT_45711 [Agaricus bisporus var. burnettii JB137-S8]EKM75860.1 hypothetical protein AGABI1DRAFT_45711 [Agaricus bisporus var. burnettii JB137-S8]